jgi:hypothetical protein
MAYIVPMEMECENPYCRTGSGGKRARATVEVRNRWNECVGRFCRKCGEARKKQQDKAEGT